VTSLNQKLIIFLSGSLNIQTSRISLILSLLQNFFNIISEKKMFLNKRRSPTFVDVYDFNTLNIREDNANINTKNYLLSKPPMSYSDLRLVVANRFPSNILILPKTLCFQSSKNTPIVQRPRKEYEKTHKQPGFDVYRSLARSVSRISITSERDPSNDEMTSLTDSVTIDRLSPLPNTGLFRPHILPKIEKHHINSDDNQKSNNNVETNCEDIESIRSTTPEIFYQTAPTSQHYEEDKDKMTTATKVLSCMRKNRTRKQLHIYMPSVNC